MVKSLHVTTVILSLCLFVGRGIWVYVLHNQLTARWIKVLPHVNDTLLLISGITLTIQVQQYPLANDWLTVKVICLLVYIMLGMMAMKYYKATRTGLISWYGAIVVFVYMLSVAINKHPAGMFIG